MSAPHYASAQRAVDGGLLLTPAQHEALNGATDRIQAMLQLTLAHGTYKALQAVLDAISTARLADSRVRQIVECDFCGREAVSRG